VRYTVIIVQEMITIGKNSVQRNVRTNIRKKVKIKYNQKQIKLL